MIDHKSLSLFSVLGVFLACSNPEKPESESIQEEKVEVKLTLALEATDSNRFVVNIPETGRYRLSFYGQGADSSSFYLEDYINNSDGRNYNITGSLSFEKDGKASIDGSPLAKGKHAMRINTLGNTQVDSLTFDLMYPQQNSPDTLIQNMDGENWELVWSDEFDGTGLPDKEIWSYNVGNWGWGNNELQYYTDAKEKNARQENGNLIIEAHKNADDSFWTSARLTSQGKTAFLYGKIEFRAKVPVGRGTWAAGWLLGDAYRDELSWPYCGEIDVLECVGFEINDSTGSGINHATCHTPAYYFKKGNQIGSEINLDSMDTKFHTYAVEWYPDVIYGLVDGERYYTYDKTANELEWPFHQAQNIIINLAIGGGWGGAKGLDSSYTSHQYILDYVRVYQKI